MRPGGSMPDLSGWGSGTHSSTVNVSVSPSVFSSNGCSVRSPMGTPRSKTGVREESRAVLTSRSRSDAAETVTR